MGWVGVAFGVTHATLKDDKVRVDPLRYSDHAEVCAASTVSVATCHLIDGVGRRIDGTREAIATRAITNDLDTPGGHLVPEWCSGFQVDWIPRQFDVCVSVFVCVGACNIRTPIAIRIRTRTPDASLLSTYTRGVDVEAGFRISTLLGAEMELTYCAAVPAQ